MTPVTAPGPETARDAVSGRAARGKAGRTTQGGLHVPAPTRREQARLGIALVLPVVIMVGVFILFPLVNAIYFMFVDFNGIEPNPPWIGFENFTELARDSAVWSALKNNVVWILIGTAAPLIIGLWLALLVFDVKRGGGIFRIAFFLPYVLPQVAVGIVWGWVYSPTRGWLNRGLEAVGLESLARGWLGHPDTALYAVLATAIWATFGFVFVIILAALRNVDMDQVDAALLDGANGWQRVRYVILPQIMPVFLTVTTITLIGGFQVFDIVFVMTGGGPAGASDVLGTYAYSSAFELNRISYGTTLALLVSVLAVPIAISLNRLQRRLSLEGTGA